MPEAAEIANEGSEPLPSSLDRLAAEALCHRLQDKVLAGQPVLLDGSAVDRVSTPCIQILVAALKGANARGIPFKLDAPSQVLIEAITDLGLRQLFAGRGA